MGRDTVAAMTAHDIASGAMPWRARVASHPWAALPVLMAGTFMVVLDFFIVNVALPAMQADLHAGTAAIEWVVAGYGLTFGTLLITAGRLGDQFGRRRMFSLGLALFTLASAACGLAATPTVLVAARLVQGIAAAMLSPQVLAIMGVVYRGPDRVRALSIYGIVLGLAAVGGQLIGGVLVQADIAGLGWRSCFLINVPIGIVALLTAGGLVPESRAGGASRLDLVGTVLVTLGLVGIVLPLVEGRQHGWPTWTWLCLAAAPVTLLAFAAHQRSLSRRGGAPLLDPALFRSRAFSAGLVTQLLFWTVQASFFLVLALYLQQGRGLDALQAGLVFTILAAAYLVASLKAPALTARFGRRLPLVGALVLGAGHALMALAVADVGTGGSIALLAPAMLLEGAGMGLIITPLTATVLSSLEPQRAGAASGALSTMQQVGNTIGVAVTGVIFFGALDRGFATAFELSMVQLAAVSLAVALLTRLLPERH
jgi:EmrB/QacA subfamily drug resistance transporter